MQNGVLLLYVGLSLFSADSPPMIITKDTVLERGAVLHHGLIIKADGVTIDGNGATLQGPGKAGDLKTFVGVGVLAEGCSDVTIRNLKVRGFESALVATDGEAWLLEGSDFSDNYHEPEFGWGEHKRNGGIILTRISRSIIRKNTANRVWNGLDLSECNDNSITGNDLSHCSNVCLRMWTSSRNTIADNNLSYGIRIKPGEVHARDSTSVLLESGSNDNKFERNDITHGGDGVFIRVLNGWVSTGNVFVENDCSYANNNCVESWSPGNVYIRNKANHGSYGFWLGGSDHTVLIGNEAAYNGLPSGNHNAPERDFGHGGIVIVGGTSSHTIVDGNYCHDNNGGGIVFRGDQRSKGEKWKAFHWIIQNNRLEANRWGIFGRFGDWFDLAGNIYKDNKEKDFFEAVSNLTIREPDPKDGRAPFARMAGPTRAEVGQKVVFDASASHDPGGRRLSYRWDLGDRVADGAIVEHVFEKPGFYRVGLTVTNGHLSDLAYRDVTVAKEVEEVGTEGQAAEWGWTMANNGDNTGRIQFADDPDALVGKTSLRMRPDPYKGAEAAGLYPRSKNAAWKLSDKQRVSFWLKFENPNIPGFQGPTPTVRLHTASGQITLSPVNEKGQEKCWLCELPYSEARWGWVLVSVPLTGGEGWKREVTGTADLSRIDWLSIQFDSWGGDPFTIWIDGLTFE
jgi:parallel beta-helix repeat protein